jgi:L-ascorbate 6-phosphate lactonase
VLDLDGIVVYHTGDSLYHADLSRQVRAFRPHLLLVCVNGQYGNMNPEEAARLACEIEPAAVIPMHWGLVAENTADPAAFVSALSSMGGTARPLVILPGDAMVSSFERI